MSGLLPARAPFGSLKAGRYDVIMIDPPWPTRMRSPKGEAKSSGAHYGSMSFDEIAALPVSDLASKHCLLFLWCTWPLLFNGGDPTRHFKDHNPAHSPVGECVKAWGGFRYVTGGGWHKLTVNGKSRWGTGYRARSVLEPFLLYVAGEPKNSRSEKNLIEGLAREHSRKPEEAFAWCERWLLKDDATRVEVFSRQTRPGWDTWGYEAGKFDPVVQVAA